ncbi:hypothetical protein R2360_24865 [Mycobacteroides chelonae]|nr:hypothetical protein [Mycobacteroides chelonae]
MRVSFTDRWVTAIRVTLMTANRTVRESISMMVLPWFVDPGARNAPPAPPDEPA